MLRLSQCHELNNNSSSNSLKEMSAVRPRKLPYKPVIGELENRTEYGSCDL